MKPGTGVRQKAEAGRAGGAKAPARRAPRVRKADTARSPAVDAQLDAHVAALLAEFEREVPVAPPPVARSQPVKAPAATQEISRLNGPLLIKDVREGWGRLQGLLGGGAVEIDVSGLTAVDTAGVQMLLALTLEAQRRRQQLKLTGACAVLDETVRALGLQSAFAAARD
ncbi:MAG: STAS domain-containing protein [Steroidobacteraceae bacterium]